MTLRRRIFLDWLAAGLAAVAILLAAPLARSVQKFISQRLGRNLFGYGVLAALTAVFVGLAVFFLHRYEDALLAAVKENMILEKYFGRTLLASGYAWPPGKKKNL